MEKYLTDPKLGLKEFRFVFVFSKSKLASAVYKGYKFTNNNKMIAR